MSFEESSTAIQTDFYLEQCQARKTTMHTSGVVEVCCKVVIKNGSICGYHLSSCRQENDMKRCLKELEEYKS